MKWYVRTNRYFSGNYSTGTHQPHKKPNLIRGGQSIQAYTSDITDRLKNMKLGSITNPDPNRNFTDDVGFTSTTLESMLHLDSRISPNTFSHTDHNKDSTQPPTGVRLTLLHQKSQHTTPVVSRHGNYMSHNFVNKKSIGGSYKMQNPGKQMGKN